MITKKERQRIASKRYRDSHRDRVLAAQQEYYKNNKDNRKKYNELNKEKIRRQSRQYIENNKEKVATRLKKYYESNREQISKQHKLYREANPEKWATHRARYCERRLHAIPSWADINKMMLIYLKCKELNDLWGTNFQVDHAIPLKGKNVSGLHVWENLQLLDQSMNNIKYNKYSV